MQRVVDELLHTLHGPADPREGFRVRGAALLSDDIDAVPDRIEQIADVMGEDGQELIARSYGLLRPTVERCVLDGHRRAAREFVGEAELPIVIREGRRPANVGDGTD